MILEFKIQLVSPLHCQNMKDQISSNKLRPRRLTNFEIYQIC